MSCIKALSAAKIIQRRWQMNEMKIWSTHGVIVTGEKGCDWRKSCPGAAFATTIRTLGSNPGLRLTARACIALGTEQHELRDISLKELSTVNDRTGTGRRSSNYTTDQNSSFADTKRLVPGPTQSPVFWVSGAFS